MPKNLTDLDVFTSPVAVPVGTDPRNAPSVETPFQALANRTHNLRQLVLGQSSVGEGQWIPRTKFIHPAKYLQTTGIVAFGAGTVLWTTRASISNLGVLSLANNGYLLLPIDIPHGAQITRIRALVKPGAARSTSNRMQIEGRVYTPNFGTPAEPTASTLFTTDEDDGTANFQLLDSGNLTITTVGTNVYEIAVRSGNDGATNKDSFVELELAWNDPGPRNF